MLLCELYWNLTIKDETQISKILFVCRSGEMPRWFLRSGFYAVICYRDPGSAYSIQMVTNDPLSCQFFRIRYHFLVSADIEYIWCIDTYSDNTLIDMKIARRTAYTIAYLYLSFKTQVVCIIKEPLQAGLPKIQWEDAFVLKPLHFLAPPNWESISK